MLYFGLVLLLVSGCAPFSIKQHYAQSPECGHVEGNLLQSPGYPHNYPTNTHCAYAIPLDKNKALKLQFLHFDVEPSVDCSYDYVEVKDQEVSYGKYCGNTLQGDEMVIDDTPFVYIEFHSDKSLTKTGFQIKLEDVDKGHVNGGHEVETVTVANTEALHLKPTTPLDFKTPSKPKAASEYNEKQTTLPSTAETNQPNPFTEFKTSEAIPDIFPTNNRATSDIFPTKDTTPDAFPTNEATHEFFPTNEVTPSVFRTNEKTPDAFPTNEATHEVFPTNEATHEFFPTNEATPNVFRTNEKTPDVFPTNEATPEVFPTNEEGTTDVFPTNEATSDVFPTNKAATDVFPTNEYSQTASETIEMTKAKPTTNERLDRFVTTKESNIPDSSPDKRQMKQGISNDNSEEDPSATTSAELNATDAMINASASSVNESFPTEVPMWNESIVSSNVTGSEGAPTEATETPEGNVDLMSTMYPTLEPESTSYNPEPEGHVLDKLKLMALLQRIKFAALQMEELLIGKIVEEEVRESRNTKGAKREMDDFRYGIDLGFGRRHKRKVKRDLGTEFIDEIKRIDQERKKNKLSKQATEVKSQN